MSKQATFRPVFLSFALVLGSAHAAQPAGADGESSSRARAIPELCVQIASEPSALEAESVRAAIEKELGVKTTSAATATSIGTVVVEADRGTSVTISYASADGSTQLKRRIALPVDGTRRATVIAWIVGNLVRNEADEILLGMLSQSATKAAIESPPEPASSSTESTSSEPAARVSTPAESAQQPPPALPTAAPSATRDPPESAVASNRAMDLGPTRVFHTALFSPTLAVPTDAARRAFHLSLGGVYSHVGALDGFGLGLLVDHVEYRLRGAQVSTLWIDSNEDTGVLIAGLGTRGRGNLRGVELTGGLTLRSGCVTGAQIAGASNVTNGSLRGLQLSGAVNYHRASTQGAQITGAVNVANDVEGLQLGVVNVARDVEGLQLGVVNVARHNRGVALGLFNWSKGARVQPTVFFQNPRYLNAGYRSISGYSTGTISFGYDPSDERARTHFGTGPRFAYDRFAFGAEVGYGWVLEHMKSKPSDRAHELDLIGIASAEIVRRVVTVYGGGGVVLPVAGVVAIEPHGLIQGGLAFF